MHTPRTRQHGFTMIETLLYVVLAGMLLFVVTSFTMSILEGRTKNTTIAEVEQQGLQAMQLITQTIRNATGITSPAVGASGASLTVTVTTPANSPTIFDVSGGQLRIKEGAAAAIPITNNLVTVSGLTFRNLSRTTTPGVVQMQFTVSRVDNSGGRNEYSFSETFTTSASRRDD